MNTTMLTEHISKETTVSNSSTESEEENILVGEFSHSGSDPAITMANMNIEILKL